MMIELYSPDGNPTEPPKKPVYYMASPYRIYAEPGDNGKGLRRAFTVAAVSAAELVKMGYTVFSPVAHSHPIAIAGKIDPFDDALWMGQCRKMVETCGGLFILAAPRFEKSRGMREELELATKLKKPIYAAVIRKGTRDDEGARDREEAR